ncbi:helix-turn-helix transcriptional regulator [Desulforhabdus sp. TSK]|uniref:ArsR/SmtB family transcription factor n=1 Tax=Desulforhabdus sp. TSK TaxID=2925014 RepID=UPI001FC8E080|nr:metalloregulator ArsR/SmtB family transcription factor [Desulforhabdus sp. TSK]GKT07790.1 hypothetical protein DSTSK_10950 [Desulforhabdus sp. TSK]
MQEFVKVMKAFSEPNRVKIVKLLQHRSMCVEELQSILGIAQPTVSNHLKVLSFAGLLACSRKGFWVYYYPSDGSSSPFAASMLGNLKHWLEDDEEFLQLMDRASSIYEENLGSAGGR